MSGEMKKDEEKAQRVDDIDAELRAAEAGLKSGPELTFHPYLTAQAFAIERRELKNTYLRLVTAARIRRKMGDHSRAEEFFKEAQRQRDGLVAIRDLLETQPEEVRAHFQTILDEWERNLQTEVAARSSAQAPG